MKKIKGKMDVYHRNEENMKGIVSKKEGGEEKESKQRKEGTTEQDGKEGQEGSQVKPKEMIKVLLTKTYKVTDNDKPQDVQIDFV